MSDKAEKLFLEIADKIGSSKGMMDYASAEPMPEWVNNVTMRFVRTFCPTLKRDDYRNRPARFHGLFAGITFSLAKAAEELEVPDLPDSPILKMVTESFDALLNTEMPLVRETLISALSLNHQMACDFFAGFSEGASGDAVEFGIARLNDNHSAQITMFLLSVRPWIDAKKIRNVGELLAVYRKIQEASGEIMFTENPAVWESFSRQFRNICSEDGVKVASRGRPRKNTSDKPSSA